MKYGYEQVIIVSIDVALRQTDLMHVLYRVRPRGRPGTLRTLQFWEGVYWVPDQLMAEF